MEHNKVYPIIDWQLALKLTANKQDLALDILNLFISTLPQDLAKLKKLYANQHISALIRETHKLHSGLCYCGLPRLKIIVIQLETDLKNNRLDNILTLLQQLENEVTILLDYYASHPLPA